MFQTLLSINTIQKAGGDGYNWIILLVSFAAYIYQMYRKAQKSKFEDMTSESDGSTSDPFDSWDEDQQVNDVDKLVKQEKNTQKSTFARNPRETLRAKANPSQKPKAKQQFQFNKKKIDLREAVIHSEILNRKYF